MARRARSSESITMRITSIDCPNCGAPVPVAERQAAAICIYCNASLRLAAAQAASGSGSAAGAPAEAPASVSDVDPQVAAQVKQMVVDGQRAEAVKLYAQQAGLSEAEAEAAVDRIITGVLMEMTQHLPLNLGGTLVGLGLMAACAALAAWAIWRAANGQPAALLWVLPALAALAGLLLWFVPKAVSGYVADMGRLGQARVLRLAIIRPELRPGGTLVTLWMEIQPAEGGPTFRDQETILVRNASLPKLQPGSLIRVRYSPKMPDRVFPTSPIAAWDAASGDFV